IMRKHMIRWGRVLFAMIILVTICSFYRAQGNNSIGPADKDNYAFLDRPDSEVASQEEKVIKKAYDKLAFLTTAYSNWRRRRPAERGMGMGMRRMAELGMSSMKRMACSVNIISSGGIEDISYRPLDDLVTPPSNERIDIVKNVHTSDRDKEGKISYSMTWV